MALRPVVAAVICVGLFIIIESLLPKAMALRNSNIDDFRIKDQRTHKRRNYMFQAGDNDILESLDNTGVSYDTEPVDSVINPEELTAFITDYANMIDDVILLDKSVETRTRKRGNIKHERNNQAIPDLPCSCKSTAVPEYLGDDTFPRNVETRICGQQHGCVYPYICEEIHYKIPVLRRKTSRNIDSSRRELMPNNLTSWIAELRSVSVGCACKKEYINKITN